MGGKREAMVGLQMQNVTDVRDALQILRLASFNFLVTDKISTDEYAAAEIAGTHDYPPDQPFSWFDLKLPSSEWSLNVVGILRDLHEYLEGDDLVVAARARKVLMREIEYAQHLCLPAVMLELNKAGNVNLAKIIQAHLMAPQHNAVNSTKFWVKVPMTFEEQTNLTENKCNGPVNKFGPWHLWNEFRSQCDFAAKLYPVLELTVNLPDDEEIERWLGESVKSIFASKDCFIQNSKGFPVFGKKHQQVVKRFMDLGAQVILKYTGESGEDEHFTDNSYYKQYINYLHHMEPEDCDLYGGDVLNFAAGYEDYLQCPLQPLQDNLESHTYEVFEKDPVKYDLYKIAIEEALVDMIPEEEIERKTVVLMVVGAGRGPLVRSSIRAASSSGRKIRIYAIEKNANAVNTLLHLKRLEWEDQVTVVNCDMREWDAPEKADIIVSELLGSFGDNELSPECLDGAQKFLKPDGVMIPQSYTSYLAPIMSSKLYNEVRGQRDVTKYMYSHFETPYVVHIRNRYEIAPPQKVFTFNHPKTDPKGTNDRYISLKFKVPMDCVLHGFSGYFESTLYGSTLMSIYPNTFSKGMFSWFPIFFPIRNPIHLRQGDELTSHFWRCSNRNSVWYEWAISSPISINIHNPNGRSYTIGL